MILIAVVGSAAQTKVIYEALLNRGYNTRMLSFPCYGSDSSELVRMYMSGEFGVDQDSVDVYAAATLYAVDRYASYKSDWGKDYESGTIIVTNGYTPSNAIYQGSKLPKGERESFLNWLYDLEYNRLGIPEPDVVFCLDLPTAARDIADYSGWRIIEDHMDMVKRVLDFSLCPLKKGGAHEL